ncbi:MAG: hypothetical protein H0U74_21200 [Bradymonadaceae bacterium]|nr:hypothetical protein [Lujinxingiaceae bacterium]
MFFETRQRPMVFALCAAMACTLAGGCEQPTSLADRQFQEQIQQEQTKKLARAAAEAEELATLVPAPRWVKPRVEEASARIQKTAGGRIIWEAIEAHGGLANFYAQGPLHFRFDYRPLGERAARDTRQIVDTWSSRARHSLSDDAQVEFAWDGQRAWELKGDKEVDLNARFWALTPYYFVGIPFVLADRGVVLKNEGEAEIEGRLYDTVRASFAPGTGDAPDDFYIVYVHKDTRLVEAIRYIVSYPGFFPDGGHSPESFMTYEKHEKLGELSFARFHRTFRWDPVTLLPGDHLTTTTVSELEFRPDTAIDAFEAPVGARIIEGWK